MTYSTTDVFTFGGYDILRIYFKDTITVKKSLATCEIQRSLYRKMQHQLRLSVS